MAWSGRNVSPQAVRRLGAPEDRPRYAPDCAPHSRAATRSGRLRRQGSSGSAPCRRAPRHPPPPRRGDCRTESIPAPQQALQAQAAQLCAPRSLKSWKARCSQNARSKAGRQWYFRLRRWGSLPLPLRVKLHLEDSPDNVSMYRMERRSSSTSGRTSRNTGAIECISRGANPAQLCIWLPVEKATWKSAMRHPAPREMLSEHNGGDDGGDGGGKAPQRTPKRSTGERGKERRSSS